MHHLILKYWENVAARGDIPKPVYAVISTGKVQPEGYTLGWSVVKGESLRQAAVKGNCVVVRIEQVEVFNS